ncbi:2-oxo acid dehydrogenase subunit E2 [Paenibacillus sp. N4]|uniref:2-oxo acid dehydrogenase subunit E2 n=1 Tax=Paenibacillus vietnamensis TaxID=2590547 RepID=UPI001CD09FD0|nr:2-oxo acid dehydrogenase subunit E2 [Paenibacillus vietnamensis]MCA0754293.1 2-oxo acid dehydrogenase subunit E2 [Paenibacillus vietnamensis]
MSDRNHSIEQQENKAASWLAMEAEVGNLVRLHYKHKDEFMRREGVKLTLLPFYINAVIHAIKAFPQMNGCIGPDGTMAVKQDVTLSLSAESAGELVTNVIEHADRISLTGFALILDRIRNRSGGSARTRQPAGTFAVKGFSGAGTFLSAPAIPAAHASCLSFETVQQKPVFVGESLTKGYFVNMCLSFDSRLLNEAACVKFLQAVKKNLGEYDPEELMYG